MQDCKSPGNDELTKVFYEYFWNVIKDPLMNSIKEARKKIKYFSTRGCDQIDRKKGQRDMLHKELASNFPS